MVCDDLYMALEERVKGYEQVCVIADEAVKCDLPYPTLRLKIDESAKTIETVQRIWDFLFAQDLTRRGLVIAVGGGVLTDMAGFAAATYKRGIDYINVPTTLLAMVDASSGGKTGFNYQGLKNSIGAFHAPVETIIDTKWLTTLPANEFLSGFGEMVKTGLVQGEKLKVKGERKLKGEKLKVKGERIEGLPVTGYGLWNSLMQYDLDTMPIDALAPLIEQCVAVKERIVAADPKEEGLRKVLNFGHTFGHAIEEIQMVNGKSSNGKWLHGYAVVYGLIAELYLSVVKLGCPKEPLQQLTQLMLHYYGRPNCKCSDRAALIDLMQHDKKNERAAEINCTLIRNIGSPVINQVITPDEVNEALEYLFSL